jgi:hypothetical protein
MAAKRPKFKRTRDGKHPVLILVLRLISDLLTTIFKGCFTCRSRRVLCDKTRPVCSHCNRLSLSCTFPDLSEINTAKRPRQKLASDPSRSLGFSSADNMNCAGPSTGPAPVSFSVSVPAPVPVARETVLPVRLDLASPSTSPLSPSPLALLPYPFASNSALDNPAPLNIPFDGTFYPFPQQPSPFFAPGFVPDSYSFPDNELIPPAPAPGPVYPPQQYSQPPLEPKYLPAATEGRRWHYNNTARDGHVADRGSSSSSWIVPATDPSSVLPLGFPSFHGLQT